MNDNNEYKYLQANVLDLAENRTQNNCVQVSRFMSEAELFAAETVLKQQKQQYFTYGGYDKAERKCIVFLPDYLNKDDIQNEAELFGISFLKIVLSDYDRQADLCHRDYMGAILGCGVKRDAVGDIIVFEGYAEAVLLNTIMSFVSENLTSVGKYKVKCMPADYIEYKEPEYKELFTTVASMRADAVAAAAFGISRSSAENEIIGKNVFINGRECSGRDSEIHEGDKISIRGKGKILVSSIKGESKKGRIRLIIKKYF